MTNTTFRRPEARTESIDELLKLVQNGQIIIPIFQRNFVWEKTDIKNIFDSIYRGYPIGNLLLWKKRLEHPNNKIKIGPLEFDLSKSNDLLAVVDGQQRLTSLASVLLLSSATVSEEEQSKWELYFNLDGKEFVFPDPKKKQEPYYYWLPMKVVADNTQYLKWLRSLDKKYENDKYIEIADNLVTAIREYKIPVYRVESDENEVREIFQRLNDMGKSLEESDIFNAIVSGREDNNSDRIQDIQDILEKKGYGIPKDNTLLKSIYAISDISLGKTSIKKVKNNDTKNQIAQLSKKIPNIYDKVMTFLQTFAEIDHLLLLPYYNVTLIPLMKIFYHFPEPSDSLQEHISSWIWKASLSEAHKNIQYQGMNIILKKISKNKNDEEKLINGLLNEEFDNLNIDKFEVKKFNFRTAKVKILCCSLLNEYPKNLETEEILDFRKIFLQHNTDSFKYILPSNKVSKEHLAMPGNRIFNHDISNKSYSNLLETAFNYVSEETLLSHFIDNYAIELFQEEMFGDFIEHRTSLMNEKAREFSTNTDL